MRRALELSAALIVAVGAASPASGTGVMSPNVEYVSTIPIDGAGAQVARIADKHLFVAGYRAFSIYDLSDPEAPELVSTTPLGASNPNESIDTNGRILILKEEIPSEKLMVWDVADKAAPTLLAEVPAPDHTVECLLECSWAYGSDGTIYDLRRPAEAKVAGNWDDGSLQFGHTVAEVAPGIALSTATPTLRLFDARSPGRPKLMATIGAPSGNVQGVSRWPRQGRDRFLLSAEESSFTARCDAASAVFRTYDTTGWKKKRTFRVLDEFRMENGTIADGRAVGGPLGCSTHGFSESPTFRDGGVVALTHYEHGTRFLEVDRSGAIEEVGYFLPAGGEASAAVWATRSIVYVMDVVRGIDVLRFSDN
jgi:hypothetical protein